MHSGSEEAMKKIIIGATVGYFAANLAVMYKIGAFGRARELVSSGKPLTFKETFIYLFEGDNDR
jgi:hypothetical protein